jgi:hypothetical protein
MVVTTIKGAHDAAEQAAREGLLGLYPSACMVLSKRLLMVNAILLRIAYPKRGSCDETLTIEDFADEIQEIYLNPQDLEHSHL